MAKRLVEFALEGGGSVIVEAEGEPSPGAQRVSRGGAMVERAQMQFESAVQGVRPFAESLLAQLRDLAEGPEEVEVQFGLKLNAGVGAVIASTAVEGACQVTLTWKRSEAKT